MSIYAIITFLAISFVLLGFLLWRWCSSSNQMTKPDHFKILHEQRAYLSQISMSGGPIGFFAQEALRFLSIAGTLKDNNMTNDSNSVDQRYISHILARSLIENFFWIIYIFNEPNQRQARYDELVNSFRKEYLKLYKEGLSINSSITQPDPSWKNLPQGLDVRSMLTAVRNDYNDKLDPLYSIYRITSFDTHGKNLNNILTSALGEQEHNFPILKLNDGFDLIANHYLHTLEILKNANELQQSLI